MKTIDVITTDYLLKQLDQTDVQIIDVRPVEAYNGWILNKEKRGGHIKGARCLPFKWLKYMDWLEIVDSKGIKINQKLMIYGYDENKIKKVAQHFVRAGFNHVFIYKNFVEEWANNNEMPMDYLKRYKQLVSAKWVKTLIDTGSAPEYNNDKLVICHAHYQNRSAYDEGHIPGAVEMDTNTLESSETWNRRTPEELKETLESLGITHDTTVILYGRFSYPNNDDPFPGSSAGHLGSIRSAFIMMYAGVKDVRILNGGLQSWEDEGFAIDTEETSKTPVFDFGVSIPSLPEIAIDTPQAKEILKSENKNLVSVRSWSEYVGEVSGYNYIEKKGRIPGSVFGNCGSDAYHMENYRNLDHTMREFGEVIKLWEEVGVTLDKFNAFYCGTGWRGSEAFFNAWLMGWPKVAVYDGGWFEWSNENNAFETGIPEGYDNIKL